MKTTILALLIATIAPSAFADGLAGLYKVVIADKCTLQGGTTELVEATPTDFSMKLYMGGYASSGLGAAFSVIFTTKIGDVINRPDAQLAKMGAETVRNIAAYNADYSEISAAEFAYATTMSDDAALAAGPNSRVSVKVTDKGLSYDLVYSDLEKYHCDLERLP